VSSGGQKCGVEECDSCTGRFGFNFNRIKSVRGGVLIVACSLLGKLLSIVKCVCGVLCISDISITFA
jgi:hypothetical protein